MNGTETWLGQLLDLAERAKLNQDYVSLGAYIYARMLQIKSGLVLSDHMPEEFRSSGGRDADEIPWLLNRIADRKDLNAIYWDMQEALQLIDGTFSAVHSPDWDTVIPLLPPPDCSLLGGKLPFAGDVFVWGRRGFACGGRWDAPLKTLRGALEPFEIMASRAAPEPNSELRNVRFYWDHGQTCRMEKPRRDNVRCELTDNHCEKESLRVALCPLEGDFHPYFEVTSPPERFHVRRGDSMKNSDLLKTHLSSVIEEAEQKQVHLLVFPELNVCERARKHIVNLLRTRRSKYPYAVLAGSFHVWKESGTQPDSDRQGKPVNEAVLLTRSFPLVTHHKRGSFYLPGRAVTETFFPDAAASRREARIAENISRGSGLEFLETVFGTIAILICADLIDRDVDGYLGVVQQLRPDLLLVVAMSDETELFQEKVRDLFEFGVGTLMVNASCVCKPAPEGQVPCLAVAHLGLFEHPGAPPAFIRWRADTSDVERWTYHQRPKTWLEFVPQPRDGVSWLEVAGKKAALVLDFHAHQEWLKLLKR